MTSTSEFDQEDDISVSSTASNPNKRKGRQWSKVWEYFERKKVGPGKDDYIAICETCKNEFAAKSTSGTTHLKNHAIRCKEKKRRMEEGEEGEGSGQVTQVFSQAQSIYDLAKMIALHDYPLSIVEHRGFRDFVRGLQPGFRFVCRNTIKKEIFAIYNAEKIRTFKLLEQIGSRIAITTDMWTAKPTKRGFMAITAHFIDNTWRLQSRILTFVFVPVPHNKEVLSDVVLESLFYWNIDRKLSTITVDNASTNDAMLRIIVDSIPKSSFLLEGECLHMRCCAHILNLIVKDGLSVVGDTIQRIRDSCLFWTATQARIEKFESAAQQLRISCSKKLEVDVKTRWDSCYYMIRSALIYKDVFPKVKQRERNYTSLPSADDWIMAEELCPKLKTFADITTVFSGTTYPTANLYFQKVCDIKLGLDTWLTSSSDVIKIMGNKMLEKYNKYWSVCHIILGVACVLDPRYKLKLVEFYFLQIYGREVYGVEVEKIKAACSNLFLEYQSKMNVAQNSGLGTSFENLDESDTLTNFDLYVNDTSMSSETELELYLKERLVSRKVEFDILEW